MSRDGGARAALALTLLSCGGKEVGSVGTGAGAQVLAACSVGQQGATSARLLSAAMVTSTHAPGGDSLTEACDGADLGSRTCASLGYFGGTLACTSSCDLDEERCVSCGSDARISACVRSVAGTTPAGLSLASTTTEIDVAWIESAPSVPSQDMHFTRYRSDFTLLSDTRCFGPSDASTVGVAAVAIRRPKPHWGSRRPDRTDAREGAATRAPSRETTRRTPLVGCLQRALPSGRRASARASERAKGWRDAFGAKRGGAALRLGTR